jgi:hypothetical protein
MPHVIGPDVAIRLAGDEAVVPDGHHMLAPALLRSQLLSRLYQAVHRGEMTKKDAERRLEYARGMRIRLHEGPVLQDVIDRRRYAEHGEPQEERAQSRPIWVVSG